MYELRDIKKLRKRFTSILKQLDIDEGLTDLFESVYLPLATHLAKAAGLHSGALVVGINGAQGSGKSTLCELLALILREGFNLKVANLSIDDIYLTRHEREQLAKEVHPLLGTRGVPGTHDVALGLKLLDELTRDDPGLELAIPVFDKACDDRTKKQYWKKVRSPLDIILFEGWCVGTTPQMNAELATPVNSLEATEDSDSCWRRYVNKCLATGYAELFDKLDLLIMLKIPAMEYVYEWRGLQERKLAAKETGKDLSGIMNEDALQRFIMHYERLTRHNLEEMPDRADIILDIGRNHQIEAMKVKLFAGQPT